MASTGANPNLGKNRKRRAKDQRRQRRPREDKAEGFPSFRPDSGSITPHVYLWAMFIADLEQQLHALSEQYRSAMRERAQLVADAYPADSRLWAERAHFWNGIDFQVVDIGTAFLTARNGNDIRIEFRCDPHGSILIDCVSIPGNERSIRPFRHSPRTRREATNLAKDKAREVIAMVTRCIHPLEEVERIAREQAEMRAQRRSTPEPDWAMFGSRQKLH